MGGKTIATSLTSRKVVIALYHLAFFLSCANRNKIVYVGFHVFLSSVSEELTRFSGNTSDKPPFIFDVMIGRL